MTRRGLSALAAALWLAGLVPALPAELVKSEILESNVDYFRVEEVGKELAGEIKSAQAALSATNQAIGTVLDLRLADGDDVNAARAVADQFGTRPVAILVNEQTRGAATALAKDLREARKGLILGDSSEVKPDITIVVKLEDEKTYLTNAFAILPPPAFVGGATNDLLPLVDHTSEADLVRAKVKDGAELEPTQQEGAPPPTPSYIRDPALARAVDLIKGLAIVQASHS
jgi:C-terminal processing protease CtpA/Prc